MADVSLRELSLIIHTKALELSARASALGDHVTAGDRANVLFIIAMIDESESAVSFWVEQLKKEASK